MDFADTVNYENNVLRDKSRVKAFSVLNTLMTSTDRTSIDILQDVRALYIDLLELHNLQDTPVGLPMPTQLMNQRMVQD